MQLPLQITFRDMEPSPAIETRIREKAEKLDQFYDHIMSCRVVVEQHHKHKHQGNLFQVRIDLKVPGSEIAVSRESHLDHSHEDAHVVIRDTFDAARRQLEDYVRRQRGHVKVHDTAPHGRILELVPMEDYGKIETPDGREIYFHRNSVSNADFDKLETGAEVRFAEETGDEGPQATNVVVVGKHHVVG